MTQVLVVEDSPTQAQLLRADLEGAGFRVTLAHSGPEALAVLAPEEMDLVLSDVVMPGMDGYQLCRSIKAKDAEARAIPVVLLTSLTDPLEIVRGLQAGADSFIRKPYQRDQLIARLHALLQNRDTVGDDPAQAAVRLSELDRNLEITAGRQQILDLLISTFEELVVTSREVRARERELSRAHAELAQQLHSANLERRRLGAVVGAVPVPLFVTGEDGRISYYSDSLRELLDVSCEQVRRAEIEHLAEFRDVDGNPIAPEDLPHRRAVRDGRAVSTGSAFELCLVRPDGTKPPVMFHASPVIDDGGEPVGCVGTVQVLGPLARHDSFTGLPNRIAFLDRAASIPSSSRGQAAVLLIQLDRFDALRTALGNRATAAILAEVSRHLRAVFQPTPGNEPSSECFLAYLGDEQFGVILVDLPDALTALRLAETSRRVVSSDVTAGPNFRLTGSVGVSTGDDSIEEPKLLAAARAAVQRARERGGDRVEFLGPDASRQEMDRFWLENDLRAALEREEISVAYQPEVELSTGRPLGFEALARWHRRGQGPVSPAVFIGLAEESGLILELGRQVLEQACTEGVRWPDVSQGRALTVSVNVSAVQLRSGFVDEVENILDKTGLDPNRLMLEVTETAAMGDPAVSVPQLDELRRRGVRFSLDDFGTGYSSMSQLTRIHFDQLKLDGSFVSGMGHGGADAIVVQSIVALGRSLDVPVLAEGVETEEQATALRALGCEQAQGYLFSRPLDTEAVRSFIGETW